MIRLAGSAGSEEFAGPGQCRRLEIMGSKPLFQLLYNRSKERGMLMRLE